MQRRTQEITLGDSFSDKIRNTVLDSKILTKLNRGIVGGKYYETIGHCKSYSYVKTVNSTE